MKNVCITYSVSSVRLQLASKVVEAVHFGVDGMINTRNFVEVVSRFVQSVLTNIHVLLFDAL